MSVNPISTKIPIFIAWHPSKKSFPRQETQTKIKNSKQQSRHHTTIAMNPQWTCGSNNLTFLSSTLERALKSFYRVHWNDQQIFIFVFPSTVIFRWIKRWWLMDSQSHSVNKRSIIECLATRHQTPSFVNKSSTEFQCHGNILKIVYLLWWIDNGYPRVPWFIRIVCK